MCLLVITTADVMVRRVVRLVVVGVDTAAGATALAQPSMIERAVEKTWVCSCLCGERVEGKG